MVNRAIDSRDEAESVTVHYDARFGPYVLIISQRFAETESVLMLCESVILGCHSRVMSSMCSICGACGPDHQLYRYSKRF